MLNNKNISKTEKSKKSAYRASFFGVMAALALALSFFESLLPPLLSLPVGAKLGLSNVVTMTAACTLGAPYAFAVVAIKGVFVFLTRGFTAMLMSLSGGLLSACAVCILFKRCFRLGYITVSIIGAVIHNITQLFVCFLFTSSFAVFLYSPFLIFCGVIAGCITGTILGALSKKEAFKKGFYKKTD